MNDTLKKQLNRRLASAGGHLKGIERMIEEDTYCMEIINQIQAVQAALHKVNSLILDEHLRHCVTTAIRGDDATEREELLKEITALFEAKNKVGG